MRGILVLALVAGCYDYDAPACTIACTTSADCPGSQACTAAGRCAPSASATCGATEDAAPDAAPPMIRVTVLDDRGSPAVGVRVIAVTPAGAAIADVMSNTQGIATFVAMVDVDVTVVRTSSTGASLTTIRGAQPGDMLTFGRPKSELPSAQRTITWPAFAPTDDYSIFATCGGGAAVNIGTTPSKVLVLEPACADDSDVLVSYFDLQTIGTGYKVKTAASGNTAFPDDGWRAYTEETANFTALPASVQHATQPWANVAFAGGTVFRASQPALGPSALGSVITGSATGASGITLAAQGMAQRELVTRANHKAVAAAVQRVAERVGPTGAYNLAIEPALLPWIVSAPATDLGARTITWVRELAGPTARTAPDLVVAEVAYDRGSLHYRWRVIAPPSAVEAIGMLGGADEQRMLIPDLPGTLAFEPVAADTLVSTIVRHYGFTATTAPTYASLRPTADVALVMTNPPYSVADRFLADGVITRMVLVTYGQP